MTRAYGDGADLVVTRLGWFRWEWTRALHTRSGRAWVVGKTYTKRGAKRAARKSSGGTR